MPIIRTRNLIFLCVRDLGGGSINKCQYGSFPAVRYQLESPTESPVKKRTKLSPTHVHLEMDHLSPKLCQLESPVKKELFKEDKRIS
ncbi:hypothetical protein AC249_AIPGENE19272 [Exaiptasia diaphana]|nr:hypothetical protein AC249_AIPGENE19272 [Exaiptasia diaphana]